MQMICSDSMKIFWTKAAEGLWRYSTFAVTTGWNGNYRYCTSCTKFPFLLHVYRLSQNPSSTRGLGMSRTKVALAWLALFASRLEGDLLQQLFDRNFSWHFALRIIRTAVDFAVLILSFLIIKMPSTWYFACS